ncbi:hypothetical protein BJF83_19940 [Nocardiopsis sp. CNR-923]|uniref:hypothetical protein n=1 Tax=Nocardiopsis sp. CNR-923 TaxID=1904965 RepID=UPI00095CA074|nr:hypothetical protein [Nocardiopsis sp. CNR-923]OLT26881.1 hypothetical protein BJF83_19940 [Nocardiopsis sp. CNR-923]
MKGRFTRPPRRTRGPEFAHQARSAWEDARWKAARQGWSLDRERRFLGAVYTLTDPNGHTTILSELAEVHRALGQSPNPDLPPAA